METKNPIKLIWNGFEWQQHRTPDEIMYHSCNQPDLVRAMACEADDFIHEVSQQMEMEWIYRFMNHRIEMVTDGVWKEVKHLYAVLEGWVLF